MSDATINDLGDELPDDDKTPGMPGHVDDHNRLSRELGEVQSVVRQIVEGGGPGIVGTVGGEQQLPETAPPGACYLIGDTGNLFTYSWATSTWVYVGNIKGPAGNNGDPGTILALLGPGEDPPPGTPFGKLFFVADSAPPTPSPDPFYVTGAAGQSASVTTLTLSIPAVLDGDLGLLAVSYDPVTSGGADNRPATPGGWTLIDTQVSNDPDHETRIYRRTMQASDNSVSIITAVGIKKAAALMVFRNVEEIPDAVTFGKASSNTLAAPSVTATTDGLVCGFYVGRHSYASSGDTLSVARPASFTNGPEALATAGGGCPTIASGYDEEITAGSVAPGNWVRTSSVAAGTSPAAWTVALAKAS